MSLSAVVRLAVAVGILVLPGKEVSACGLWLCGDYDGYAPMRAPAHDPRVGPTWTPNGWSYLPASIYAQPPRGSDRLYGAGYEYDLKGDWRTREFPRRRP
jgi:hypothetical protein